MRMISLLLLLMSLSLQSSFAQSGTWSTNTFGSGVFYDVFFTDSLHGCAVGTAGQIYTTTNGGSIWNLQVQVTTAPLRSVYFLNRDTGYAVGDDNTVLKTTNQGAGWSVLQNSPGSGIQFYQVYFSTPETGWIIQSVSGVWSMNSTTDGGAHWTERSPNIAPAYYLFSSGGTNMWVSGGSAIYHTADGQNWSHVDILSSYSPKEISFVADSIGYGLSNGIIVKTTDAGAHWDTLSFPGGNGFQSIFFDSEKDGWVAGNGVGIIYHSTDSGKTWVNELDVGRVGTVVGLFKIFFINKNNGWAVGTADGKLVVCRYSPSTLGVSESGHANPQSISLSQNYPNPFNPVTNIRYTLRTTEVVSLKVFDVLGRVVATVADGKQYAGEHEASWDARDFPSGTYFYRLYTKDLFETKRMLLIK